MPTFSRIQENMDRDGILMLSLSVFGMLITFGAGLFWLVIRVYKEAKSAKPSLQNPIWILFGKQLNNNQLDAEYRQRLDAALNWLPLEQPQYLILQGGITQKNTMSEAQAGQAYLESNKKVGLHNSKSSYQLVLEDTSRNTLENLKQTRDYLRQKDLPLKVALISNRYHLRRCAVMAKNLGFETVYIPAEMEWTLNKNQLFKILLEAFFLHWFYVGRFVSRLLNNKRMLDKIS